MDLGLTFRWLPMMTVSVYQPPARCASNSRPGCGIDGELAGAVAALPHRVAAHVAVGARVAQEHAVAVLVAAVANARIQILAGLHAEHIAAERLAHRAVATPEK